MTRKSARKHRRQESRRDQHIYLPHSSWSHASTARTSAPIAAEDFWARLGL